MPKQHWMISLVRSIAIIFVLFGCILVFWYTPFYSSFVVKVLNTFVPVDVDQVAAESQKRAALTEREDFEPGSKTWIARQAYLTLMEQKIREKSTQDLVLIQARYQLLQQKIEQERAEEDQQDAKNTPPIPLLVRQDATAASEVFSEASIALEQAAASEALLAQVGDYLKPVESDEDKALKAQYTDFLTQHPIDEPTEKVLDQQIYQDLALIQNQDEQKKKDAAVPNAIVILGGGLTLASNKVDIVVNDYTRLRLEKTLQIEQQTHLPIVLSGVEAPYMQSWLKVRGVSANLLENRSMNTCENTRFSSLLLQKKGGAPKVILITDRYHMPRTRRLFALNGIQTIAVEAPMPTQLTQWRPSRQNYDHSRRANYELLATIRDVLFGSSGCREVP